MKVQECSIEHDKVPYHKSLDKIFVPFYILLQNSGSSIAVVDFEGLIALQPTDKKSRFHPAK